MDVLQSCMWAQLRAVISNACATESWSRLR